MAGKIFSKLFHSPRAAHHAEFVESVTSRYPAKILADKSSEIPRKQEGVRRAMTTLVTGATGSLGSYVARQLVAAGEKVRVLVRASSSNSCAIADSPLECITGYLRDQASLQRAIQGVKKVFHVAADYRLSGRKSRGHLRFERGRHQKFPVGRKTSRIDRLIYTSTVATIAVDRPRCRTNSRIRSSTK